MALTRSFLSVKSVCKKVMYCLRYRLVLVKVVEMAAVTFFVDLQKLVRFLGFLWWLCGADP